MIEDSVPTFSAFCQHQDPAVLAANQDFINQYEEIVQLYASFASKDNPVATKNAKSVPIRIRFRKAGLAAIKGIAESDSITAETAKQLSIILPAILENIYSEDGKYLLELEDLQYKRAEVDKEMALKRRQSTTVVPTIPDIPDPIAARGSTEAADKLAEQETGVIALQALKQIFAAVPQGQLRLATSAVLKFLGDRISPKEHFPASTVIPLQSGSWPCRLMGMICGWAPVGDRHGILVTAVEELVRTPLREDTFEKQYVLATITGWLLSSEINFIGLSVMDVLVGLLQHILDLMHVTVPGSSTPRGVENGLELGKDDVPDAEHDNFESAYPIAASKAQLLAQFQRCIGCLAVHVYYSDQVGDMISAILSRIKPMNLSASGTGTPEAEGSTGSIPRRSIDEYFTSERAKLAALRSIKEIIIWANWVKPDGTSSSTSRHPITVDRWEGTQWLMRDQNWAIRLAYTDVLLVWMRYELKKSSLRVAEPTQRRSSKKDKEKKDHSTKEGNLARRAVSNASRRDKSPAPVQTTFLPLLHLVIYDNALQYAASEHDVLLLHLLLSTLVEKLGINAAQNGLPMIARLQEDLTDVDDALSKIHIASLVHGYLTAISAYFHFDASATGREISTEISERIKNGLWLHTIKVPSMPLEEVAQRRPRDQSVPDLDSITFEPFTKFATLVDKMAQGYEVSLYSPPSSPPTSPMRKLTSPMLEQSPMSFPKKQMNYLSDTTRESLLAEWSRESVLSANAAANGSRTGSISGTSPTNGSGKHLSVSVAAYAPGTNGDLAPSPRRSLHGQAYHNLNSPSPYRGSRPVSAAQGARDAQYHSQAFREALMMTSASMGGRPRTSHTGTPYTNTSSVRSSVRVEDLKRVLAGNAPAAVSVAPVIYEPEDSASDSMVSYDGSDFTAPSRHDMAMSRNRNPPLVLVDAGTPVLENGQNGARASDGSVTPRPLTAVSIASGHQLTRSRSNSSPEPETEDEDIPPVPPVPETYANLSPSRTPESSMHRAQSTSQQLPSPPHSPTIAPVSKLARSTPSAAKAESIRSANVRESLRRSISTRDGTTSILPTLGGSDTSHNHNKNVQPRSAWNARDLLESIDSNWLSSPSGSLAARPSTGRLKPPY